MINVIIDRGLYDEDFVANYAHGWKRFCQRAKKYPLSWAAAKTGLSEDEIIAAAETYASIKPLGIHWGVALEQTKNCTNTIRLLLSLMAMTANPDQPSLSTHHTLTMTDTRYVFADFEDMVWVPRKRLLKREHYQFVKAYPRGNGDLG